jgi:hypothetical protein
MATELVAISQKIPLKKNCPLVLYFGGNAEEVSHLADFKKYFPNTIMVLMNYRSFGLSQGKSQNKPCLVMLWKCMIN